MLVCGSDPIVGVQILFNTARDSLARHSGAGCAAIVTILVRYRFQNLLLVGPGVLIRRDLSGFGIVSLRFTPVQNHPSLKLRVTGVIPPFCCGSDPIVGVQNLFNTARDSLARHSGAGCAAIVTILVRYRFQNLLLVGPGVLIRRDYTKIKNDRKGRLLFW